MPDRREFKRVAGIVVAIGAVFSLVLFLQAWHDEADSLGEDRAADSSEVAPVDSSSDAPTVSRDDERVDVVADGDHTWLRLRVVDGEGRPLAKIHGSARRRGPDGGFSDSGPIRLGPTDEDGRTEQWVPRGTYEIFVNQAHLEVGDTIGYGVAGEPPKKPDPRWRLTHEHACIPRCEVFGESRELSVVLLRFPCEIEVVVRDGRAVPVEGIGVGAGYQPSVTTNERGEARIECLPEGRTDVELIDSTFGPGFTYSASIRKKTVILRAGVPTRVEFDLVKNGAIEVAIARCGDGARDLKLYCDDDDASDGNSANFERVGAIGSVLRFDGVPPARYGISVVSSGDDPCWAPRISGIHVVEGTTTRIDLPLAPMTRTFSGRVLDRDDHPRSGVLITVFDLNGGTTRKSATTNAAGEFAIVGLPDIPLRGGCDPTNSPGDVPAFFGSFEQPWFDVPATNTPVELRLERGCTIRGKVIVRGKLDRPDLWVAIDRFRSRIDGAVRARPTIVDARGAHYEFEFTNLRGGAYRLRVGDSFSTANTPVIEVVVAPDTLGTRNVEVDLEYTPSR